MSPICRNPFSLFLLALFCMLLATPIRASTQHHHHNHQNRHSGTASENTAESSNQIENNNLAIEADEQLTMTTQGNAPAENGNGNDELLNSPMEEANRGIGSGKALFREYLDRGMLTCSTKYFGILRKLNKLISTAHAEYTACQRMAEKADRSGQSAKLAAQLDMINELLND